MRYLLFLSITLAILTSCSKDSVHISDYDDEFIDQNTVVDSNNDIENNDFETGNNKDEDQIDAENDEIEDQDEDKNEDEDINYTASFSVIQDNFDPATDIVFGDTFGNIYYSKNDSGSIFKDNTINKNILKLGNDGDFLWQLQLLLPTANEITIFDYSLDHYKDSIIISGMLDYGGAYDMFLAKITALGFQSWIKLWGTGDPGFPYSIATDSDENIYVTGGVCGSFDENNPAGDPGTPLMFDAFISKWDKNGNNLWNKQSGKQKIDIILGATVDESDNILITGIENVNHSFAINMSNYGTSMFLRKLDRNGDQIWETTESDSNDVVYGMDVGIVGNEIAVLGHRCFQKALSTDDYCRIVPYVKRFDDSGTELREVTWVGKQDDGDVWTSSVKMTVHNEKIYAILHSRYFQNAPSDTMIAIIDIHNDIQLSQVFHSPCQDYPQHISILFENSVMITGITDGWIGDDLETAECDSEVFKPFVMVLDPF